MKFGDFIHFIYSALLVSFLLLIMAIVNALSFLPREISFSLPIVVFFIGAIIQFRAQKRRKEFGFINRLKNFVRDFNDKIANISYSYSLISIAFRIANHETIRQKTIAWQLFLSRLNEDLTKKGILLSDRIEHRKGEFTSLFEDFRTLLSLFGEFKRQLYNMLNDTKETKDFSKDSGFEKIYKRFNEEFNKYMDKLEIFSDEVKAEFGLSLREDLTEHVKDLNELYKPQ